MTSSISAYKFDPIGKERLEFEYSPVKLKALF